MKSVLAALCLISVWILLSHPIQAQPAVVPTAEGQIGETPNPNTEIDGPIIQPIDGPADLIFGRLGLPLGSTPPPPELEFFTDMIHGYPDPVPIDDVSGTFNNTTVTTPDSSRSRNAADNDDFVAFSFSFDSATPNMTDVRVMSFDSFGNVLVNMPIRTLETFGLDETGIVVDNQGRATVYYSEFPSSGVPPIRVVGQRVDAVTGLVLDPDFMVNDDNGAADVALLDPSGNRLIVASTDFIASSVEGNIVDFTGGTPVVGPPFPISTTPAFTNGPVEVAADPTTGAFLAAWENVTGAAGDPVNIRARRFDAMGNPVGDDFIVNTTTANAQGQPTVAVGPNGETVVGWAGDAGGGNPDDLDVFIQVFDAAGNPIGGELRVNTFTDHIQDRPQVRFLPELDSLGQPQVLVVWRDVANIDGTGARGTGTSYKCFSIGDDPTFIFADGFEIGDTTSWSDTVVP